MILNHTCKSLVGVPYYSVGLYEIICIHCGSDEGVREEPHVYPICSMCFENKLKTKQKRCVLVDVMLKIKKHYFKVNRASGKLRVSYLGNI